MELITTKICMSPDIGVHGNLFGGTMMSWIDEAAAAYACQICDSPKMITVKINELLFKKPIKVGNLIKIYGEVKEFGRTSVTLNIEVRKHNVYTGTQEVVTHTEIKFVRIDDDSNPIPISQRVMKRYDDRIGQYGRGLLSFEELETSKKS